MLLPAGATATATVKVTKPDGTTEVHVVPVEFIDQPQED